MMVKQPAAGGLPMASPFASASLAYSQSAEGSGSSAGSSHVPGLSTPGRESTPLRGQPSLTSSTSLTLSSCGSRNPFAAAAGGPSGELSETSGGGSARGASQLWRQSTAVSDMVEELLGCTNVADMCGPSFIPADRLKRLKALGEGAFADVEKARLAPATCASQQAQQQQAQQQPQVVAVKRLKPHLLESERDCWSFIAESRLLISLAPHPAIVRCIGLGCADDSSPEAQWRTLCLVQEFASGGTLKRLIFNQMLEPTRKLYSLADAVRWGQQIAEGLAHMHSISPMVVHRDLKAENVLLKPGPSGQRDAVIADFGLHALLPLPASPVAEMDEERAAQQQASDGQRCEGDSTRAQASEGRQSGPKYQMTGQTGAFLYMAPEVLMGHDYNEKVDVFSYGVILYELLHLRLVVSELMYLGDAEDAKRHAFKVANGYRMPVSTDLPQALQRLVKECWSSNPDHRPSMADVAARLREVEQSGEILEAELLFGPQPSAGCCTVM